MCVMDIEVRAEGDASERLWRQYGEELVRFASVLVGPGDAHDVAVEAVLRASRRLGQVEETAHRAYLHRAVANQAKNWARSRSRRWRRDLAGVGPASTGASDPQLDVRRAVAALSVLQRAVVFLVYWADMTERDAAEFLGISPGSVRQHMVRARANLRKALDD
ncbi:MAG: hypothetical protein RI900_3053 [Actinomycetota bacterium]|jgi:RNA polymerase sigma factor (sigma-70 family)